MDQELFDRINAQSTAAMDQAWAAEVAKIPPDYRTRENLIGVLKAAFVSGFDAGVKFAALFVLRERHGGGGA